MKRPRVLSVVIPALGGAATVVVTVAAVYVMTRPIPAVPPPAPAKISRAGRGGIPGFRPVDVAPESSAASVDEARVAPSSSVADARRAARRVVQTPEQLGRFTEALEERARARGVVTSHELAAGIAAIEAVRAREGMDVVRREVERFRARLVGLSQTLATTRPADPSLAPALR